MKDTHPSHNDFLIQVDHSRVNEFGFSGEMLEEKEKAAIEKNGGGEAAAGSAPAAIENEKQAVPDKDKSAQEKKTD